MVRMQCGKAVMKTHFCCLTVTWRILKTDSHFALALVNEESFVSLPLVKVMASRMRELARGRWCARATVEVKWMLLLEKWRESR